MDESTSSSASSDSPETQTIVITPSELEKMGLAKELKHAIEAQTQKKADAATISSSKPADDTAELSMDAKSLQKKMKNKLCTLLNHTPLVMQVKNVDWMSSGKSSPVILNSASRTPPSAEDSDDSETKPKLKIVSDEKSNISASEIESMLISGKLLKNDDKISSPLQKQTDDVKDEAKTSTNIDAESQASQSTSKESASDPSIIKKECLKRIQAKMYENLKKVLQEVDSHPTKNKPTSSYVALPTEPEKSMTPTKLVTAGKSVERKKENKPCYMSTYRERKTSQDSSDSTKTKSPTNDDVIEIDSKPSSPVIASKSTVIDVDADIDVTKTVKTPKKRGRPPKEQIEIETPQNGDAEKQERRETGSPLKKSIVKRFSESSNTSITPEEIADIEESKQTPRKRGRPRKYPPKEEIPTTSKDHKGTGNEATETSLGEKPPPRKRGRPPKKRNVDTTAGSTSEQDKETDEKERIDEQKQSSEKERTSQDTSNNTQESTSQSALQGEVKTPKKRGRKSKAELAALNKENDNVTTPRRTPHAYTQSKTSGRKRKIVNYSLLNGEDSDLDEPVVKGRRGDSSYRRKATRGYYEEDSDESSEDEYVSSTSNEKIEDDQDDDDIVLTKLKLEGDKKRGRGRPPKAKLVKYEENRKEYVNKQKGIKNESKDEDVKKEESKDKSAGKQESKDENSRVQESKNELTKEGGKEEDSEKEEESKGEEVKAKESTSDAVECAVCKQTVERASWSEHKRTAHNDLAWISGEEPLNLEDTTLVEEILNLVFREEGTLKCGTCQIENESVENYIQHKNSCNNSVNTIKGPHVKRGKNKRKPGGFADMMDSLFSKTVATDLHTNESSETNTASTSTASVKLEKNEIQCAVCSKIVAKQQWYVHKQSKHNNLAWRVGDPPLDLNDRTLVIKILNELYLKKKPLHCEICGENRKSVVGFLSHKIQCTKSDHEIEGMKVTCHLCEKRMLPVSLPRHMDLTHPKIVPETTKMLEKVEVENVIPTGKRKAAHKAAEILHAFSEDGPEKTKRYLREVRFRSKDEVITKFNEDIRNCGKASCVYENCSYAVNEAEDLFQHLENCLKKCSKGYTCNFCLATFQKRKSIREHIKSVHSNDEKRNLIMYHGLPEEEEFGDGDSSDGDEKEEMMSEIMPYTKVQKMQYTKYHAKFLGPFTRKSARSCYRNAYKWTCDYYQDNYSNLNLFPDILTKKDIWRKLVNSKITDYLPKLKYSIDFSIRKVDHIENPINCNHDWTRYKLFQSHIETDGTTLIFCGGPISSMSWAPTPHNLAKEDQILAIGVIPDPDKEYFSRYKYKDKGLIQFWNYGPLDNQTVPSNKPKLDFCIAHNHGVIWCMEWCPSGCYDSSAVNGLRKLGLLAVSSADSFVYIYAVLRPQQQPGRIFEVVPTFKLVMSDKQDMNLGEIPCHASKISWSKVVGHAYIAVGFSNGIISIFKLETNSKLLQEVVDDVIVVKPIQTFKAHNQVISGLVLYHLNDGKRWLISGSLDREIKLWDMTNISEPINCNRKFMVTDAVWSMHWLSAIYSFNHCTHMSSVPSALVPARNFNGAVTPFLPSNSGTTSISFNEWANVLAQANESGEMTCGFPGQLLYSFDNDKRKAVRKSRVLTSYTSCIPKHLTIEERKASENSKLLRLKKKGNSNKPITPEPITYEDVRDSYGLVICDVNMNMKTKQPSKEMDKLVHNIPFHSVSKPEMYPIQSITKLEFNPNKNSYMYYACGYQVGLVRTSALQLK